MGLRDATYRPLPAALEHESDHGEAFDPLSLLCRLASSVPPPRRHTVRYAGVFAPASKLRPRLVPKPPQASANDTSPAPKPGVGTGLGPSFSIGYQFVVDLRRWAAIEPWPM